MDQASWAMIRSTAAEVAQLLNEVSELRAKLVEIEILAKKRPNYGQRKRMDVFEKRLAKVEKAKASRHES